MGHSQQRSWKGDQCYSEVLKDHFKGKSLCEITPLLVEKFKHERIKTPTKYGRPRAEASVNREFEMLSRVFNLAIDFKNAETNPCSRVRKFKLDNERYRYLKAATNEIRPPVMAAVNYWIIGRGERIRTSDLSVPNQRFGKKLSFCQFESCSHHEFARVLRLFPIRYHRISLLC